MSTISAFKSIKLPYIISQYNFPSWNSNVFLHGFPIWSSWTLFSCMFSISLRSLANKLLHGGELYVVICNHYTRMIMYLGFTCYIQYCVWFYQCKMCDFNSAEWSDIRDVHHNSVRDVFRLLSVLQRYAESVSMVVWDVRHTTRCRSGLGFDFRIRAQTIVLWSGM